MDSVVIKAGIKLGTESGWMILATHDDYVAAGSPIGSVIRVEITKNHQGGCDCKIASVKVNGGVLVAEIPENPDGLSSYKEKLSNFQVHSGLAPELLLVALETRKLPESCKLTDSLQIAFDKLLVRCCFK